MTGACPDGRFVTWRVKYVFCWFRRNFVPKSLLCTAVGAAASLHVHYVAAGLGDFRGSASSVAANFGSCVRMYHTLYLGRKSAMPLFIHTSWLLALRRSSG